MADAGRTHTYEHIAFAYGGHGDLLQLERMMNLD
jgi:hypothetical protein